MPSQSGITARAIQLLWDAHHKEVAEEKLDVFDTTGFSKAARSQEEILGKEVGEYITQYTDGLISTGELIIKISDLY